MQRTREQTLSPIAISWRLADHPRWTFHFTPTSASWLGMARSTVRETLQRAESAGVSWPLAEGMNDGALDAALYANRRSKRGHRRVAERYGRRSTVITSQLPVDRWHEIIGDPTYADAILDRLVHNAHRIELTGESLRRTRTKQTIKA